MLSVERVNAHVSGRIQRNKPPSLFQTFTVFYSSKPRPLYKHHVLCSLTILHTSYPAYEDGTDRVFRNVGIQQSDAGEIPKRIHTK